MRARRMKRLGAACGALAALVVTSPASAAPPSGSAASRGAAAVGAGPRPTIPPPVVWSAPEPANSTTASGARVLVLERHELPMVHLLVMVHAGASLDPPGRPGLASAVATMLQDGGAGARSGPALSQALEELGAELHIHCDRDGASLSLAVMSSRLGEALALVGDLVARPRFDAAEWTRVKARRVAEIARRHDEPRFIADAVFDRALYGDRHPYGAPLLGTRAAVESFTVDDLRAFYAAHYAPSTTSVVMVGDVAPGRAGKLVDEALAGWSARPRPETPPPAAPRAPARIVLVDRPGAPQSEVRVGFVGLARSTELYAPMAVLDMVLGGSFTSRLVQNLREKHGYTYGVHSRFELFEAPGPFVVRSAIRTDVTAPALTELFGELRAIAAPLPAAEANKGRALVRNGLVEEFSDGDQAAALIGDLALHRLPLDTWRRLPAELEALTPATLGAAAKRLFAAPLTVVVVGDRKAIEPSLRALPGGQKIELRDADGAVLAPATK